MTIKVGFNERGLMARTQDKERDLVKCEGMVARHEFHEWASILVPFAFKE